MTTDPESELKTDDPKCQVKAKKKLEGVLPHAKDQDEIDDLLEVPTVAEIVANSRRSQKKQQKDESKKPFYKDAKSKLMFDLTDLK